MGHRNYSMFSQTKNQLKQEDTVEENKEVIDESITEELEDKVVIEESNNPTLGLVDGCDKLYVRKEGNKDAEYVSIINKSDEVVIDLENSTEYFYKVKTSDGIEGYCMKKFITIK